MDAVKPLVQAWLEQDRMASHKQRHTALHKFERLNDEYGFTGSRRSVSELVRELRNAAKRPEVFCPIEHRAGQEVQTDNETWYYYTSAGLTSIERQGNLDRAYGYDANGNLTNQKDRNGRLTEFAYDRLNRRTSEKWKSASGTVLRNLQFSYDAASNLLSADDPGKAKTSFAYDGLGQATTITEELANLAAVTLNQTFDVAGERTKLETLIGTKKDLINDYTFDFLGRLTSVSQHEATGSSSVKNSVAPKRVDLTYNALSQFSTIQRFQDLAGTQLVTTGTFGYDNDARLTSLVHTGASSNTLASYGWTFDAANRLTGFTNGTHTQESATYSYDNADQLTGADRSGTSQDESFAFDANGNRSGGSYQTAAFNRTTNDGTFTYKYDNEGNRIERRRTSDNSVTQYTWDYRNRLSNVTEKNSSGVVTKAADLLYDTYDRWIGETVDADGLVRNPP